MVMVASMLVPSCKRWRNVRCTAIRMLTLVRNGQCVPRASGQRREAPRPLRSAGRVERGQVSTHTGTPPNDHPAPFPVAAPAPASLKNILEFSLAMTGARNGNKRET